MVATDLLQKLNWGNIVQRTGPPVLNCDFAFAESTSKNGKGKGGKRKKSRPVILPTYPVPSEH